MRTCRILLASPFVLLGVIGLGFLAVAITLLPDDLF